MINLLVTGGCGFIGSHTCLSLLEREFNIIVIDSNINSNQLSLKKIIEIGEIKNKKFNNKLSFINGDIRDYELLDSIFLNSIKNKSPIDAVIHFAGLKAVEESMKNPLLYWDNNLCGSISLFKVMEKYGCSNIVFSSSATIYGNSRKKLISEDEELKPSNIYGETKLAIERVLEGLNVSSGNVWKIANLRYFNPIGAHETGLIGENPSSLPNNLFPYICKVAYGELERLNIFGNDWATPDGTCIRDFIHVVDLAEAHCATLVYLLKNKPTILNLNIGTGKGTSVLELVNTFMEVNKCKIPFAFTERREGDVPLVVADNKLALKLLDWFPKRDLIDMCKDGWKWQNNHPKGF
tara:strand:- start:2008 stop:3060 length:1053 start_codon:yes stop_codon:yes gene_type:complete